MHMNTTQYRTNSILDLAVKTELKKAIANLDNNADA